MSANELSLTFLLKLDGSQAATELPRLTAQIASELEKLNKPSDGAAAAAITSQKTLGQQTIAVQQQTNTSVLKQMDAMWAARDKQQADALQKQIEIEKAFASQEVSTAQSTQKEIAKAFEDRGKAAQTSAQEIAKIFAAREQEQGRSAAQQLAITRQTEKEGEAIVAQSNANREKAIKTSLNNATRAASQSAAAQIRSQLQTAQAAVDSNSLIEKSLAALGDHFNLFIGHRIPIAGGAFVRLTENVKGFVAISKETEGSVLRLGNIIAGIATKAGKPVDEIKTFLQTFASLGTQVEKDEAAVNTFGPALAQSLIPQLARADAEMAALTASTAEAGAGFAAMAGPIGIALIALAAVIASVTLAEKKMFDLAEASAKVEGRFVDLSQQTGLSTELLSAFDVIASTTGSNLDGLAQSFVIFQRHLEDAQDPMSTSAGLFGELGIQTTDTETALRQTFTVLARMPEGFRQTALAQELFGRSGKSILAIIKETNGNLDEAIKRFRELGLIVSEEDARAADRFNDELELLRRQFEDLEVELGKNFLPAALEIVHSLSDLTSAAKPLFELIGTVGKPVFEQFANQLRAVSLIVSSFTHDFVTIAKILNEINDRTEIKPLTVPEIQPTPLPGPESALEKAGDEARLIRAEVNEAVRFADAQMAAIDRQIKLREINPAEALEPVIALEKSKTEAVIKGLEAQREARANAFIKAEADRKKQSDDITAKNEADQEKQLENIRIVSAKDRKQQADDIAEFDQKIADERSRFDKFEADKRADFRAQELQQEQAHRRRILDVFVASLNDRIAALDRSVQAGVNSELFAQNVTVELLKAGFERRKQVLEQERREAGKDPALIQQINSQLADLQRERTAALGEQSDRRIQILRNETQKALDLQRQTIDSLLRATQIVDESRIAGIKALVDLRVKSEEQGAREILRIRLAEIDQEKQIARTERDVVDAQIKERLDAFSKQRATLDRQLSEADAIKEPTQRNTERKRLREELLANINAEIDAQKKANKDRSDADTELNNKLRVLNAERSQIEAEGARDIEDKRQQDLENARRYNRELDQIADRTVEIEQETAREIINLMEIHFARRKDIIIAQREFDLTEERLRHERVTESIRRQQSEVEEQIRILEVHLKAVKVGTHEEIEELEKLQQKLGELRAKRAELTRQQQAEDDRTKTRKQTVTDASDKAAQEADPLGRLDLGTEGLERFSSTIESSVIPLNQALTDSFTGVADAISQTVENWVLLGETGPAVGRKILAQVLANLAKEATVNLIKETALGFATLFLNPAESASHFTAAGIWALLAGGAALGGRKAAGGLFKQQRSGSAGGAGTSGGTAGQINPVTLSRNAGTPPVINVQVLMHGEAAAAFDYKVTKVVSNNFRSGGELRETFNNDGGV